MSEAASGAHETAAELARAFDAAFMQAPVSEDESWEDVLAIQIGSHAHALRLSQIRGLYARRAIVPVPGPLRELLGLMSVRSAIVPVYDLAALLGLTNESEPRWTALATDLPIALGFSGLEGLRRVPRDAIVPALSPAPDVASTELLRTPEGTRPLIHLPRVLEAIAKLAQQAKHSEGSPDVR
ncbi:MAG TPA: chemotaxis protein CheW [Polyangiaceae bacterium]|nr:chemotaxis protein CheW [Polyangiaceae bacterium]